MLVSKVESGARLAMPTIVCEAEVKDDLDFIFGDDSFDHFIAAQIAIYNVDTGVGSLSEITQIGAHYPG